MSREIPEWIAKHDDQKVPDRVRTRVFERENGICHITGRKIDPVRDQWDLDHKLALILGGEHRESNLFPALREHHRKKTAVEMGVKAKIARVKKKHLGLGKPKSSLSHPYLKKRMDGSVVDTRTGEIVR
jgi:5-methylcytosine-specific restriction endonuclease McrA